MAGRRLLILALLGALLVGSAGCRRGSGAPNATGTTTPPIAVETTPPTEATTPPTSAPSYAVPEVIDAAYVETVMKALDHAYGEAIRIMARDRQLSDEFLNHLLAIYTPKEFDLAQDLWLRDLAMGLQELSPNPGDPVTRVERLTRSSAACTVAVVSRDFSATRTGPVTTTPQRYIGLVPKPEGRDPLGVNRTPWVMSLTASYSREQSRGNRADQIDSTHLPVFFDSPRVFNSGLG